MFPPPEPDSDDGQHAAEAARALLPLLEELRPHVVVSDILTLAPALAAERAGVPLATLVPHIYPVVEPGQPFFAIGLRRRARRSAGAAGGPGSGRCGSDSSTAAATSTSSAGGSAWPPLTRFHGGISPDLALVATYPQLEYPRRWPAGVEVTGPMSFELPHPDVELPPGEEPLVLVAPSTAHDSDNHLVRTALAALAGEPVRVVATTNRVRPAAADRGPRQRRPGRLAQLQPADAARRARRLPRRPRHRRPRSRRRHPDAGLPDHRRHERDRDAGRLGRRRAVAALAAVPAGAAALGGAPPARRALLHGPGGRDRRLGARARRRGAAPSWSSSWRPRQAAAAQTD